MKRTFCHCIALLGITLMMAGNGWSAEPVTPIGFLLVNPSAFHHKVLKLDGIAKNVAVISGVETITQRLVCGADFDLEDNSGTIHVLYQVRCQAGEQHAAAVAERTRIVVEGYMEALPSVVRTSDGKELGVQIIARVVTPVN